MSAPSCSPLDALACQMAQHMGCTREQAADALAELQKVGLVAVQAGCVVLPLAPRLPAPEAAHGV